MIDTAGGVHTAGHSPRALTAAPLLAPWWTGTVPLGVDTPNTVATRTQRTETPTTPIAGKDIPSPQQTDDQTDTDRRGCRDR